MKMPKVLFFTVGMVPTEDETTAGAELGNVAFRMASAIGTTDRPEDCDAVASLDTEIIPRVYLTNDAARNIVERPVVNSLDEVVTLFREMQERETANATADTGAVVAADGKEGKGKAGSRKAASAAAAAWTPQA